MTSSGAARMWGWGVGDDDVIYKAHWVSLQMLIVHGETNKQQTNCGQCKYSSRQRWWVIC